MGTRNVICIFYKGRFMVAQYTQWDGYLEGQGWQILKFLLVPGNIERLKTGMEHITIVNDAAVQQLVNGHGFHTYDRAGRQVCECGAVTPVSGPSTCAPSTLSRDTGAKIFEIIASAKSDSYVPFQLDLPFVTHWMCEFCYCVDLDRDVFELFGGHVQAVKVEEGQELTGKYRFAAVDPNEPLVPYFLKAFAFSDLPKDLDDMLTRVAVEKPTMVKDEIDEEEEEEEEEDDYTCKDKYSDDDDNDYDRNGDRNGHNGGAEPRS